MLARRPEFLFALLVLPPSCGAGDGTSDSAVTSGASTSDDATTDEDATGSTSPSSSGDSTGSGLCMPSGVLELDATRTVEAASVTSSATLLNALEHCKKDKVAIEIVLDTHTVDLLGYDIVAAASLETSNGAVVEAGFMWEGGSESSHHRDGVLRVAAPPLAGAAWLRLTLPALAGVDRVFEWDAELLAHDLP